MGSSLVLIGLVFMVVPTLSSINVHEMKIDGVANIEMILKTAQYGKSPLHPWLNQQRLTDMVRQPLIGQHFQWKSCMTGTLLNLTSLDLGPDPLQFPGSLDVSFTGSISDDIDAPLVMKTVIKRQIGQYAWLEIPCIEGVGSCTYGDLCDMLQGATCPKPFVDNQVPCKCPFPSGSYKLHKSSFNIPVKVPGGNYYAKLDLSFMKQPVLCLEILFHIVD